MSNLTLEYLMNTEFSNGENAEEMKKAFLKFKEFYRKSHSNQKRLEYKIDELEKEIKKKDILLEKIEKEIKLTDDKWKSLKDRDLTLKERLLGKVFTNKYKRKFRIFGKYL